MKPNIGKADRLIRLSIAIALLGYAYWFGSWIALAGSAFVFFEVFASWCAFYALLGKSSCPVKSSKVKK